MEIYWNIGPLNRSYVWHKTLYLLQMHYEWIEWSSLSFYETFITLSNMFKETSIKYKIQHFDAL
jgi:hypothetical protein